MMLYLELFLSFAQIGLFSFGGGMAALPLIENQAVQVKGWLALSEFVDLITIAEMTPGPISVNSATFVGTKVAGPLGAISATFGVIFPSVVLVLVLASLYHKYRDLPVLAKVLRGLRPASAALIGAAGFAIVKVALKKTPQEALSLQNFSGFSLLLLIASFFLLVRYKKSPLFIIGLTGLIGGLSYVLFS